MHHKKQNYSSGISEKKIGILLILTTLAILFGGIVFINNTTASSQVVVSNNAKVVVESDTFDWGNIPINGGNVTKKFTIKNTGTENLQLTNIKTSCHCTTASVNISGNESPSFGMSGTSQWVGEMKPGQEATLNVVFDPLFHGPQGTGPINRYISVETNDKSNSKLTFSLTGVVIK